MDLLVAQGKPLLAQDDTWRAYTLLRNTAALLPQTEKGQSRAALLDAQGRFLAGSDPVRLRTGEQALGVLINGRLLSTVSGATQPEYNGTFVIAGVATSLFQGDGNSIFQPNPVPMLRLRMGVRPLTVNTTAQWERLVVTKTGDANADQITEVALWRDMNGDLSSMRPGGPARRYNWRKQPAPMRRPRSARRESWR